MILHCYSISPSIFLPQTFPNSPPINSSNLWSLLGHISSDYVDLLPQPSNLTLFICLSHQHWRQSSYWKSRWPQQQGKRQVIFSLSHALQFPFPSFNPCPIVDNPRGLVFSLFLYSLGISQISWQIQLSSLQCTLLAPRVLAHPNYFFYFSKQRNTVYAGSPVATYKVQ